MAEVIHRYIPAGGKLPKPSPEERKRQAAQHKADVELAKERAEGLRIKRLQNSLVLARARGELIPKALAQQQAGFLLVALRQKILLIPQTYSRRLLNIADREEMAAKLKEMALSILHEIEDLPSQVTNPNWLDELAREEKKSKG